MSVDPVEWFTPKPRKHRLRQFCLVRRRDRTGVSGIGVVATGVVLPTGRVVMEWFTGSRNISIYDTMRELEAVHAHGRDTEVVWLGGDT